MDGEMDGGIYEGMDGGTHGGTNGRMDGRRGGIHISLFFLEKKRMNSREISLLDLKEFSFHFSLLEKS